MILAAPQLAQHLDRGLQSLYILCGDEPLLLQEAQDAIRVRARKAGFSERSVHTVVGAHSDWSAVLAAASSLSLFADKQLLEVRVPSGKPGKDGALALQQLAQTAPGNDSTLVVVVLPQPERATRESAWFGALERAGVLLDIKPVERANLGPWLAQRLAAVGLKVEPGEPGQRTLQFFADQVEGNLLAAHQEVQKLALLYPTGGVLRFEQVQRAVLDVARFDVFKLGEAVLSGQVARVQRMLDGLQAEGVSEVLVHYTLAEDLRALRRVRAAMDHGQPLPLALREQRIWGERERLFARVLPRLRLPVLTRMVQDAHIVDGINKGLARPDWPATGWQALHRLALNLCRLCTVR